MKYFNLEMKFANVENKKTIYCWYVTTKYKNDILQAWGNTIEEAINDLFEAVSFEKSLV